jgi:hypothetical protein
MFIENFLQPKFCITYLHLNPFHVVTLLETRLLRCEDVYCLQFMKSYVTDSDCIAQNFCTSVNGEF